MRAILFICIVVLFSGCGQRQQKTVIQCESIVIERDGKLHLRLRPISADKGEIVADMLNQEGLLDDEWEYDLGISFPKTYTVTLVKTTEREGIYRNAPLHLIYNMQRTGNYDRGFVEPR